MMTIDAAKDADGRLTDAGIDAALAARGLVPSEPARPAIRAGIRRLAASVERLRAVMPDAGDAGG